MNSAGCSWLWILGRAEVNSAAEHLIAGPAAALTYGLASPSRDTEKEELRLRLPEGGLRRFHGVAGVRSGDGWTVKDEVRDIRKGKGHREDCPVLGSVIVAVTPLQGEGHCGSVCVLSCCVDGMVLTGKDGMGE